MRYVLDSSGADVLTVDIDGDVTVYNPETERSVPLTPTASDVLALCDGTMDGADIGRLLADAFGEDLDQLLHEVNQAIDLLLSEDLIQRRRVDRG